MTVLSEVVEEKLKEDIIVGYFKPNQKLHIKRLTQRYGCGTSPIREALSRLTHTQMVVALGQRGFCAPPVSQTHLDDIILAFRSITHACVTSAIINRHASSEKFIQQSLSKLKNICRSKSNTIDAVSAVETQQSVFFNALIKACPSKWLLNQAAYLQQHLQRYKNIFNQTTHKAMIRYSCARQEQMAAAFLNGDHLLLCQLIDTYIDKTHDYLSHCLAQKSTCETL